MNKQFIDSPEGVSDLMKELWLRHIAKANKLTNNIFEVKLPPPTKADFERTKEKENIRPDDEQEDLYGGWF